MGSRKHGPCWEATCDSCGHVNGWLWQKEEPTGSATQCGWCGYTCSWLFVEVPEVGFLGRLSGFSTSESDFTPHFNRGFGAGVESLAHMKALQEVHGTVDAVCKGEGVDRYAPRDILDRVKQHRKTREQLANGTYRPGGGVSVEYRDE